MVADAIVTAVVTETEDEKSLGGDSIPIIQMGLLLSIVFYGVVTFLHHYWHHYQQVWKMTHFLSSKLMILNFITTQILEKITLFEIFIFCPKIQLWFPEKIVDFLGEKLVKMLWFWTF